MTHLRMLPDDSQSAQEVKNVCPQALCGIAGPRRGRFFTMGESGTHPYLVPPRRERTAERIRLC